MAKILPIFLPFASCQNKCLFCDQQAITGVKAETDFIALAVSQTDKWLGISDVWDEAAFYGGNFLAIDKNTRARLYEIPRGKGINKIRFSTRPDTVSEETLSEIKDYDIGTVELGIQSLDDEVLSANLRPYNKKEALKAVDDISAITCCGVQLMTGMYKQSYESAIDDAAFLSSLSITCARVYPALVLKNTGLEKLFLKGLYAPTDLKDIILSAGAMFIHFKSRGINVIRIGLPDDAENSGAVTAGARHSALGDIIRTFVMLLYMDMGGEISYSGYKKIGKSMFAGNFKKYGAADITGIDKICFELRGYYLEDSRRFFEGKAAFIAGKLADTAYNR